ncbi:unnamed protein product [Mytilus coruscus]|uniref:Uncharacterized protein n=1 Tax=Mytilus coruscus TaxID=42192 RepID=A0A6J8ESQ5_MYTCO|nr:unnamed protein product [Mytilus coruscus]
MIKPTNGFLLGKIPTAIDSDKHEGCYLQNNRGRTELLRAMFYSNKSIDIFCNANSVYFESLLLTCQERALQESVIECGNITDIVQGSVSCIGTITRNVTTILSGRKQYDNVLNTTEHMLRHLMSACGVNFGPILNVTRSDDPYNSQQDVPIILSYLGKIQSLLKIISHRI